MLAVVPLVLSPAAKVDKAFRSKTAGTMTFVVTNVSDDGPGSLREALLAANNNGGADTIAFNITGPSRTIRPQLGLPGITDSVIIDGTTQPGFSSKPIVELNGTNSPSIGLFINARMTIVRGLVINGFQLGGIVLGSNSGDDRVEGCYIGTDITGTFPVPNNGPGVSIFSSNNIIGGTTVAARNVISGNSFAGVQVELFCCTGTHPTIVGNTIQGNFIGVNARGDKAIPNQREGILITTAAGDASVTSTQVGGTAPGSGNVISGNRFDGVLLGSFTTTGNFIQGNLIGTDVTGTVAIPNDGDGVRIDLARDNVIGGSEPAARNIISGNGRNGSGTGLGNGLTVGGSGNAVRGNFIGTNAAGSGALGNLLNGTSVRGTSNTIGGTAPGEGNVIAYNGYNGIASNGPSNSSNSFRGNSIFSNGFFNQTASVGIDLGEPGPTVNDIGDGDTGANELQNFPIITSVTAGANFINVRGTLNTKPSTAFSLDFYANSACDPQGYGEGEQPIGWGVTTTDANGNATFDFTLAEVLSSNQVVTATATDMAGNTSEFSRCSPMPLPATMQIMLDESGPNPNQAAALDSVLFLRDPFPIVNSTNLLNRGVDRNTRISLFITNVQLAADEPGSVVRIELTDSSNRTFDVAAEGVLSLPNFGFTQVTFRLPAELSVGMCAIRVRVHDHATNSSTIRIQQ